MSDLNYNETHSKAMQAMFPSDKTLGINPYYLAKKTLQFTDSNAEIQNFSGTIPGTPLQREGK
jgi:hypothetical protein